MWRWGSATFGTHLQGPLPRLISNFLFSCRSNIKQEHSQGQARPRQAQAQPSRAKPCQAQAEPKNQRQGKESQDKSKQDQTKQDQTSRGNSHLTESVRGEFLLKFDLGPHVASLVMSTPLFVKLFMSGAGGAQVSG